MSKTKNTDATDTTQAPRRQHKKRGAGPNMDKFYGKWATMHPFIVNKKLTQLTKHESKNWRAPQ